MNDETKHKTTYLEYTTGKSNKFWELTRDGSNNKVRYGPIGTSGKFQVKTLANEEAAQRDAERLINQKRKKGYADRERDIVITIIPDDYHIDCVGVLPNGNQVMVIRELCFDRTTEQTTDFVATYQWDEEGYFIDAQIEKIGTRGQGAHDATGTLPMMALRTGSTETHQQAIDRLVGRKLTTIRVRPFRLENDGIEFGFIINDYGGYTGVDVMPGNTLSFTEPFDGSYDT